MALKITNIEEVKNKKIFIDNKFFSMYRSILALPVFTLKNKTDKIKLIYKEYSYYTNVSIHSDPLNVTTDFATYSFITIKSNESKTLDFKFNLKEFYDFVDPEGKQKNNRSHLKDELKKSLIKLRSFTMVFDIKNTTFICGLIDDGEINDKECYIKMNKNYKNFWLADKENIYNIEFYKILNKTKLEYSKLLYLYVICNNIREYNTFSIEKLKERFLSGKMEDKKFVYNLRKAINELKEIGFILDFEEVKEHNKGKTISFKIKTKEINIKKIAQDNKKDNKILPEVFKVEKEEVKVFEDVEYMTEEEYNEIFNNKF
jgi:ribosomal protein S8